MDIEKREKWKLEVPRILKNKSASRCFFAKVKPTTSFDPGCAPVYLNVYDLTPINGYFYWAGLGIFHSGVEVHGVEYAFGAHEYPTSGVFEVEPRQCPGFKFRESIFIGTTSLDPFKVREFMESNSARYHGDTYHLIVKNCNHFCKDICYKLTGKHIPKWVNRLAGIGSMCNCVLPEALKTSVVRHDPNYQPYDGEKRRLTHAFSYDGEKRRLTHAFSYDGEKRRLTQAFSCLSSVSMRQKSSLLVQSPLRGCSPPWDSKKPNDVFY